MRAVAGVYAAFPIWLQIAGAVRGAAMISVADRSVLGDAATQFGSVSDVLALRAFDERERRAMGRR